MSIINTIDSALETIDLNKCSFIVGSLGTLVGIAGLIVSSISLHRVGTIKKVVEYNELIDEYNEFRIEIQKELNGFLDAYNNKIRQAENQSENKCKQVIDYDNSYFERFEKIIERIKRYQSIEEVQEILKDCKTITGLLLQNDISNIKKGKDLIKIKLENIIILLNKEGTKKDGK